MSIMFLYYSEEQAVLGREVQAHTADTNLISTNEFLMRYPSVNEHMPASCHDEFFKVGNLSLLLRLAANHQLTPSKGGFVVNPASVYAHT